MALVKPVGAVFGLLKAVIDRGGATGFARSKNAAGKVTDNERLEAEGKADQAKGDVKQIGEKVKGASQD